MVPLVWSRAQNGRYSNFKLTYIETQNEINELFIALLALPAARILPSRYDGGFLSGDLGFVYSKISSNAVDAKSTIPLLAQIIKPAPDAAI